MFLTQKEATKEYNKGLILENRENSLYVRLFRLFWFFHFTTSKNRAVRGRKYKFDNKFWKVFNTYEPNKNSNFIKKIKMIRNKEVHLIKRDKNRDKGYTK